MKRNKYEIEKNKQYGKYITIDYVDYTMPCGITEKRWKCLKDGKETFTKPATLVKHAELQEVKDEENKILVDKNLSHLGFRKRKYRGYQDNAKNRKHLFNLSFDEFNELISKNCFYCNSEPSIPDSKEYQEYKIKNQTDLKINGIDRIDSNIGYQLDNCVSCCSICNLMKNNLIQKDFLKHIEKIYYFSKSSTTIPKGSTLQANGGGNGTLEREDIVSTSMET